MKLSSIPAKLLVTTLVLASTTGLAFANSKGHNYKDEPTFKDAAPCPQPATLKDGFYVGAQAGYDSYRIRQSFALPGFAASTVGASNGWVGGLFAGYGQYFNDMYYLAGEVLANYNGTNNTIFTMNDNDGDSAWERFKAKGTVGLSVLPGLKLNDTSLGYARLGYDWTRFEGKASGISDTVAYSASKSTTQGGWLFGLGIETLLANNWSLRSEYTHVYYSSFNFGADSMSPSDNQFMLGLSYHFA